MIDIQGKQETGYNLPTLGEFQGGAVRQLHASSLVAYHHRLRASGAPEQVVAEHLLRQAGTAIVQMAVFSQDEKVWNWYEMDLKPHLPPASQTAFEELIKKARESSESAIPNFLERVTSQFFEGGERTAQRLLAVLGSSPKLIGAGVQYSPKGSNLPALDDNESYTLDYLTAEGYIGRGKDRREVLAAIESGEIDSEQNGTLISGASFNAYRESQAPSPAPEARRLPSPGLEDKVSRHEAEPSHGVQYRQLDANAEYAISEILGRLRAVPPSAANAFRKAYEDGKLELGERKRILGSSVNEWNEERIEAQGGAPVGVPLGKPMRRARSSVPGKAAPGGDYASSGDDIPFIDAVQTILKPEYRRGTDNWNNVQASLHGVRAQYLEKQLKRPLEKAKIGGTGRSVYIIHQKDLVHILSIMYDGMMSTSHKASMQRPRGYSPSESPEGKRPSMPARGQTCSAPDYSHLQVIADEDSGDYLSGMQAIERFLVVEPAKSGVQKHNQANTARRHVAEWGLKDVPGARWNGKPGKGARLYVPKTRQAIRALVNWGKEKLPWGEHISLESALEKIAESGESSAPVSRRAATPPRGNATTISTGLDYSRVIDSLRQQGIYVSKDDIAAVCKNDSPTSQDIFDASQQGKFNPYKALATYQEIAALLSAELAAKTKKQVDISSYEEKLKAALGVPTVAAKADVDEHRWARKSVVERKWSKLLGILIAGAS